MSAFYWCLLGSEVDGAALLGAAVKEEGWVPSHLGVYPVIRPVYNDGRAQ